MFFSKPSLKEFQSEYDACINMRISEGQFHWERFNLILIINTIILGFVGFSYSKEFVIPFYIQFIVPLIGIILCLLWLQMTQRGIMWIKFWTDQARIIEEHIQKANKNKEKIYPFIEGHKYKLSHPAGIDTHLVSYLIIIIFVFLYLGIYLEAFFRFHF